MPCKKLTRQEYNSLPNPKPIGFSTATECGCNCNPINWNLYILKIGQYSYPFPTYGYQSFTYSNQSVIDRPKSAVWSWYAGLAGVYGPGDDWVEGGKEGRFMPPPGLTVPDCGINPPPGYTTSVGISFNITITCDPMLGYTGIINSNWGVGSVGSNCSWSFNIIRNINGDPTGVTNMVHTNGSACQHDPSYCCTLYNGVPFYATWVASCSPPEISWEII